MDSNDKISIIIMAKPPEEGEAKTRLSLEIGDKSAIVIYRELLNDTIKSVSSVKDISKFIYTYGSEKHLDSLKENSFRIIKDIGKYKLREKVYDAFIKSFKTNKYAIMIVSDDVFLTTSCLEKAKKYLLKNNVVIGPTFDGGLYLIGISLEHIQIVESLPFGKADLCEELIKRAVRNKFSVKTMEMHIDIDSKKHIEKAISISRNDNRRLVSLQELI